MLKFLCSSVLLAVIALTTACIADDAVILNQDGSDYVIYHAPDAPATVRDGAQQLQQYIAESTGVKLPVVTETPAADQPVINVGDTDLSRAAGIDPAKLPWESYRILVTKGRVWIVGRDTADGQQTPQGGTSAGTRNGVMTFLEEQLGVRWLMPGDHGDVVPQHEQLTIAEMDRVDQPAFINRRLPYAQRGPEIDRWMQRQKMGYSIELIHWHNWRNTVPEELFDEHPDWFALVGGKRVPPIGRYKIETTNPELIAHFAARGVNWFQRDAKRYCFSLSPSDSRGWSQSPESLALTETDKHGNESVTPLVLKFYNDVAGLIYEQNSDRIVSGYIYMDYLYPPKDGVKSLAPNLWLIVAPHISYAYMMYKPEVREDWLEVISFWGDTTDQLAYYDLPVWWRQHLGLIMPVGPSILQFIFTNIHEKGYKGAYLYGNEAWGAGGVTNYVQARMMWDATLDPNALIHEYFELAYGPEAGAAVEKMYAMIDDAFATQYRQLKQPPLGPTTELLRDIYAANHAQIEAFYHQATEATLTDDQRYRLDMLGQNLMLLRWNLVNRGLIKADPDSPLTRSNDQIMKMIADPNNQLSLGKMELDTKVGDVPQVVVRSYDEELKNASSLDNEYRLRGLTEIVLYPQSEDEIRITPKFLWQKGESVIYRVYGAGGQLLSDGMLQQGKPIVIYGGTRQPLVVRLLAKQAIYTIDIEGAPYALRSVGDVGSLHFQNTTTPVYFYMPEDVDQCTITLSSAAPNETATATVVDPTGKVVGRLETSERAADRLAINNVSGGGFWSVRFGAADTGIVDDVHLQIDGLDVFYVIDPEQPIIVDTQK